MKTISVRKFSIFIIFFLLIFVERIVFLKLIPNPITTSDSPSYFQFTLWRNQRLYFVPMIYKFIGDHEKIIIFNILFDCSAWVVLLYSLLKVSQKSTILPTILTLSLAITTPVFITDYYVMSESTNISLSILLIAFTYLFWLEGTRKSLFLFTGTLILWLSAKQAHALTGYVVVGAYIFIVFASRKKIGSKLAIFLIFSMILFEGLMLIQVLGPSPTSIWNVVAIVFYVIGKKAEWMNWFYENGWPKDYISLDPQGAPMITEAISSDTNEVFFKEKSVSLYIEFLKSHPFYTLFSAYFLPLIGGSVYSWNHTIGAAFAFGARWNLPNLDLSTLNIINFWWFETAKDAWQMLFFVVIICFATILYNRNFSTVRSMSIPAIVILFVIFVRGALEWLVAPGDFQRVYLEHGIVIRVAILYLFIASINSTKTGNALKVAKYD